ncbi:unnamed protein product [Peronospora belbahrii]|uniref:CCHC-type domain-containing protein n=1 Tax=Peronospora belbahrii TaxID=622444 RepID=A0ABN8CZ65_9STRA|nr:unnamed protein product [Peronospora belbahrii]
MEVDKFDDKEGDNLMLCFRQVESAMFIADITYEPYEICRWLSQTVDIHMWCITARYFFPHGKRELTEYVQELKTLIASMVIDPMPEAVTVTIFMEGFRVGVARTEVFQVNPSSFEEAVVGAWNAETNFKAARPATYNYSSDGSVPMDCSQVEDAEAELQDAEQQIVRRCYICKSTGYLMAKCPA